jgi:hypothetical protein
MVHIRMPSCSVELKYYKRVFQASLPLHGLDSSTKFSSSLRSFGLFSRNTWWWMFRCRTTHRFWHRTGTTCPDYDIFHGACFSQQLGIISFHWVPSDFCNCCKLVCLGQRFVISKL